LEPVIEDLSTWTSWVGPPTNDLLGAATFCPRLTFVKLPARQLPQPARKQPGSATASAYHPSFNWMPALDP
jgi:hypothetical protein